MQLSDRELERFIVEQYIYNNYFKKDFNIKIFNDSWIEIADSNDPFLSMDVNESEIIAKKPKKTNIFNVYNDNRKMKFNLGFSQVVNISDLPNPDRLDSTIFKNSKNGYYPELVLQRQSEILLLANFITIKSRKSMLGFVEVKDGRCNF